MVDQSKALGTGEGISKSKEADKYEQAECPESHDSLEGSHAI